MPRLTNTICAMLLPDWSHTASGESKTLSDSVLSVL